MTAPKLRFKEFDGDWTKVSLDKVSKVFDGTHQTPNYVESGIKFVSVENIHAPYDSDKFITVEAFKKDFKNQPQQNDILMTRITAGEIGATAIVDDREPLAYYVSLALIRPKAVVTTPFLNQYIGTPFFKNELHKRIIHVAFPKKINLGDINECLVSLPDKQEEQTKIASFLSAVDEKISQLTQKHELLSQYKQGMMQKLFSQQIRFKADDGSEFGEWDFIELGTATDVTKLAGYEFTKHIVYKDSGNLIALRGLNVKNNKLDLSDVKYIDDSDLKMLGRSKLYIDDLIFTYVGTIGDVALIQENEKFYLAPNVARIRANKELLNPVYLLQYFNETSFRRNEIEKYIATSSQPALSMTNIRKFHIAKPCLDEQTKIANLLSAIDQKVEVVAQQIEQAKIWKKGLLQQMFV